MSIRSHSIAVRTLAGLTVATALAVASAGAFVEPAAAATTASSRTITVTGVGEVRGTPDVADLSIGVAGRGASAADALGTVSDRANKLILVLHDAGIADADIQTNDLSIQPTFDDHNHITGYESSNTIVARLRDLTRAGAVVDAATANVGDNIRLQGITFSIDDDSNLLAAARAKATKRARAQAAQLADGAGVSVGNVLSIHETNNDTPIEYPMAANAAGAASTPVQPGTQTLSVSATVVFAID